MKGRSQNPEAKRKENQQNLVSALLFWLLATEFWIPPFVLTPAFN
jgi:hypothetical protein